MGKWFLAAAIWLPLAAHAAPAVQPSPFMVGVRAPVSAAGPALSFDYVAKAPATSPADESDWGLRATLQGRSLDLRSRASGWTPEPNVGLSDIEAGYGRRDGPASVVVGYAQTDRAPLDPWAARRTHSARPRDGSTGVLGLNLIWRSH
jgi:hypothetical protein